jgi:hypothetical protein
MNVKEAIAQARDYFVDAFADYEKQKPTLEEVWFDDVSQHWHVTFGLQRPGLSSPLLPYLPAVSGTIYKVVELSDKDGKVISIKVRQPERV